MQKYKIGFLIGRFQPFHKGHLKLLKQSFKFVEKMKIGIGSVGVIDKDNFLSYEDRKKIIEKVITEERFKGKISRIVPLKDFHNDKLWLDNGLKNAGKINVVIGNNEWTNGIFERAGYPVLRLGFFKRYLYEGAKIRKLMAQKKRWQDRVPNYTVNLLYGYIAKLLND